MTSGGHGESSTGWESYSRTDTAGDLIHVVEKLGGPSVIVGQSFSGGSATIAAATNPDLVRAIVEIDPATRPPAISVSALLRNARYRRGTTLLGTLLITGRVGTWLKYLDVAFPGRKPADWDTWLSALRANLNETGRMRAAVKMARSSPSDAAAQLPNVRCPVLVVMGRKDPDWAEPEAEAAAIVGLLPAGLGSYQMIEDAGHYPHAEYPQRVADVVLAFLTESNHA